ncbi:ACP S-malonyltransferase [Novosphingobium sp.]|uniref:ACP S-malonyltransferase n=1 Tax=Novosphingobium sp. TaxID=1874826 RepID=UPI0025E27305|nr:ACP S-malonyltransferase [Novosphingobium sp.]
MAKESALVVCPGRGTYNAPELGYLARHHAGHHDLAQFDAIRVKAGKEPLTALDGMAKFQPSLHTRGDVAAPLIHAAAWCDFTAIDRERFEVVAVTGNSMGWYIALACAGAVTPDAGFRIADAMGVNSQKHARGGQMVLVLAGDDWRIDPALAAQVEAAVKAAGALPSIQLGGMLVVAGEAQALAALEAALPPLPRPPLHLAGNGPFHTPLMGPSTRAARSELPQAWFGNPALPLIDGRGAIVRPFTSTSAALWDYTFGAQILETYDFTAALTVAIREFAPERIVLLGPGETLGGAIGQVLVGLRWEGIDSKAAFMARQAGDPILLAMGRADQRALTVPATR